MNVFKLPRLFGLSLLGLVVVTPLRSQGDDAGGVAYPAPKIPDDPNLLKVAMLRLWFVGQPDSTGVTLVREAGGEPPQVIESGIQAGLFSPYVVQRPGKFKLHLLNGSVKKPADPAEKLPLEEKKLVDPIEVELRPGSYQTLVIKQTADQWTSELAEDRRPESSSPPLLHVADFSGLDGWKIQLANRQGQILQPIWDSGQGGTLPVALGLTGIYRIVVSRRGGDGFRDVGVLETELARGVSLTVLLIPGQAGSGAANLFFNAVPGAGYHPAWVKAVAEGK